MLSVPRQLDDAGNEGIIGEGSRQVALDRAPEPKWRNWQTRQVQDLVSVKDVEVRVLSSALSSKALTANCCCLQPQLLHPIQISLVD